MGKILAGAVGAVVAFALSIVVMVCLLTGAANAANTNTCDTGLQSVGNGQNGPGKGGDSPVFDGTRQNSPNQVVVPLDPQGSQESAQWNADQVRNASTITNVARSMHLSPRAAVIAVAVAMQESTLNNLSGGDRDSVGLFQQRPSAGWGTVAELTDPVTASSKFYNALVQVPGWQTQPLTEAAQSVQQSGFPGAYAKWEQAAGALVSKTWGQHAVTSISTGCQTSSGKDPQSHFSVKNPRTVDQAIAAARKAPSIPLPLATCNSAGDWFHCCDNFVSQVYGYGSSGYDTANAQWFAAVDAGRAHPGDDSPPPGALLYYDTGESAGHVAVYLGDDQVASTDITEPGHIGIVPRKELTDGTWRLRYRGWAEPWFPQGGGTSSI